MPISNPYGLRIGQRVKTTMGIPTAGRVHRGHFMGENPGRSLEEVKRLAKIRHEKERKAARRRGRKDFPMFPYECSWAFEEEFKRKHGRNPELLIVGNPPKWERKLGVPERHQLRIARDTLKMHDAMVGVMGGPTKAEAREIIRRYESRCGRNPGGRRRSIGKNPELLIIGNPPHKAFDVYLRGRKIDTVFYGHNSMVTADEVRRSLINHDGYDSGIVVRQSRKGRNPMRKRRRSRNSWKGHKVAHRKAALKGWRKRSRSKSRKSSHRKRKGSRKAYSGKMVIRYKNQRIGKGALIKKLGNRAKANSLWRKAKKMKARR